VAVKVQRPGIEALIEADMQLLLVFLDAMKPMFPPTDFDTIASEIAAMVRAETDYVAEAEHGEVVGEALASMPGVFVPRPVRALSSGRVLTTELVIGRKITLALDDLAALGTDEAQARISEILGTLLEAYVQQILIHGRFHADPHPGNLLVREDDTVVLLDFGCTRLVDNDARQAYLRLVQAFMVGDREGMAASFEVLGFRTRSGRPDTLHAFADAMLSELRQRAAGEKRAKLDADALLEEAARLMQVATDDPVERLPEEFVMLARVFGSLGGLFLHYEPDLDLGRHLAPVLMTAMTQA
jgi:ubiquinone biosynthesis protein